MGRAIADGGYPVARSLPSPTICPPPLSRSLRERRPQIAAAQGRRAPDRSISPPRVDRRALCMGRWLLY
jgi:hypothetical protein